jgi:hypothetical protein
MRCRLAAVILSVVGAPFAGPLHAQAPIRCDVVDERGSPVAGAAVAIGEPGSEPTPLGSTNADGSFAGTPAPHSAASEIYVSAPGHGGAAILAALLEVHGEGPFLPIVLGRGIALVGRVRDPTGRPLAGAEVHASELRSTMSAMWSWRAWARTATDQGGIFYLQGVPESNQRLTVSAAGHLTVSIAPVVLGTPLEVTLPPSGWIRGTVVDGKGAPVAADIEVEYEHRDGVQTARAGADGRFELTWRHPAFCRVCARSGEPAAAVAYSDVLEKVPADLRLVLRPVAELPLLRVRATGDGGAPLPAFRAFAAWWGNSDAPDDYLWQQFARDSRPARDGLCCLAAPPADGPQTGVVMVVAPGRATYFAEVEWKPATDGATEIAVVTKPGRTQRGTVVDAAGKPVAGAFVWARRATKNDGRPASMPDFDAVRTGADGAFALDGLGAGGWRVRGSQGTRVAKSLPVEVRADADPEPLRIQLPQLVRVHGRGLGVEAGWRLAFAPVGIDAAADFLFGGGYSFGDTEPREALCAFAADGAFAVEGVQAGTHRLSLLLPRPAHCGGWLRVDQRPARVAAGSDDELVVDAQLDRAGVIRGKVAMTGALVPPERLLVELKPAKPGLVQLPSSITDVFGWRRGDAVGRDGSFEIQVAPGRYGLRVLDALSGIVLAQTAEPVDVDGGAVATPTVTVEAGELRVEFTAADADEHGPGAWLEYRKPGADSPDWTRRLRSVDLGDTLSSTVLYVPVGPGEFAVVTRRLPAVRPLAVRQPGDWGPRDEEHESAKVDFDADAKRPTTVQVEVPRRRVFP